MIAVELPATMECDTEDGCKAGSGDTPARLGVKLVLNAGGTLSPRLPQGNGWQIGVAPNGVFVTRCPQHHALVEKAAPRLELVKH